MIMLQIIKSQFLGYNIQSTLGLTSVESMKIEKIVTKLTEYKQEYNEPQ